MIRGSSTAALVALLIGSPTVAVQAQNQLEVEHHVWTDSVDRTNWQFGRIYKSPVKLREIFLWTRLKGSRELLDQLRASADGFIPIRHLWQRYDSDQLVAKGDVQLNVGKKEKLHLLRYQVDAEGFFLWTVWSKNNLTRGYWRVEVVYGDTYEPVMCPGSGAEKPCAFAIEVR